LSIKIFEGIGENGFRDGGARYDGWPPDVVSAKTRATGAFRRRRLGAMGVTRLMGVLLGGWRFWQQRKALQEQHLGSGAADAFTALFGDHRQSVAGGERFAPRAPKQPESADASDGLAERAAFRVDEIAFLAPADLSRTAPEPLRLLACPHSLSTSRNRNSIA